MHLSYANEFTALGGDGPITATAFSTKGLDALQVRDWGTGEPIKAYARITQAFNNLTSLQIDIGVCDDTSGTNFTSVLNGGKVVLLAALTLNALIPLGFVSAGAAKKRFMCAKFTVTGTAPTTGKVTCGLVDRDAAVQDNINVL